MGALWRLRRIGDSPLMIPNIRHHTAPPPMGCRWCGMESRGHSSRWVPSKRWHSWEEPTRDQITARWWARDRAEIRKARQASADSKMVSLRGGESQ